MNPRPQARPGRRRMAPPLRPVAPWRSHCSSPVADRLPKIRPTVWASARRRQTRARSFPLHLRLERYRCPLHSAAARGSARCYRFAVRQAPAGAVRREHPRSSVALAFLPSPRPGLRAAMRSARRFARAFRLPRADTSNGAWCHARCGNTNAGRPASRLSARKGNRPPRARRCAEMRCERRRLREDWRMRVRRTSRFGWA